MILALQVTSPAAVLLGDVATVKVTVLACPPEIVSAFGVGGMTIMATLDGFVAMKASTVIELFAGTCVEADI
jgi:hypothetical protein